MNKMGKHFFTIPSKKQSPPPLTPSLYFTYIKVLSADYLRDLYICLIPIWYSIELDSMKNAYPKSISISYLICFSLVY